MIEKEWDNRIQTHCWRDLADYGKQEPNEALTNKITSVNLEHHSENRNHRTCFRRMRSRPFASPASKCRRNKPMSMMRSNTTSVISEPNLLGFMIPGLSMMHVLSSGDHEKRSYGWQMSLGCPKIVNVENSPV
jgi:hypothetical protein